MRGAQSVGKKGYKQVRSVELQRVCCYERYIEHFWRYHSRHNKPYRRVFEELQNRQHNVIDIAEPGSFAFFGMMQSSRSVNGNVRVAVIQFYSSSH